jgi:coenzyme PQQ precursor peptide PqqA
MLLAVRAPGLRLQYPGARRHGVAAHNHGETPMIWETPVAIDFRFGMEITMYVSNR